MGFLPILLSALLLLGQLPVAPNQEAANKPTDIYLQVPEEQRESLRQALEKLVLAEKRGDWRAVWELYDRRPEETEEGFLKKMKRRRHLRQFQPSQMYFYPPESSWIIQGCASFEGSPKHKGLWANVHARWRESRWYLSPVLIALPEGSEKGMNVRGCPIVQPKPTSTTRKDSPWGCPLG